MLVTATLDSGHIYDLDPVTSSYEPSHDKTNTMTVRPAKTQSGCTLRSDWASAQQWTQAFFMRTAKTLIQGRSESSLSAHAILLVLS